MTDMVFSDKGKMFLTMNEGISLSKYLDSVNVQTIGGGSTISDIPDLHSWPWTKQITLKEAFELMDKGLKKYIDAVNRAVKVPLKQHQFDALVSWCYNVGTGGMAGSTAIKRINAGASDRDVAAAILMWKKPPEIISRRKREANLYVTGEYGSTKATIFPVSPTTHKPLYKAGRVIDMKDYV